MSLNSGTMKLHIFVHPPAKIGLDLLKTAGSKLSLELAMNLHELCMNSRYYSKGFF